MLPSGNDAAVTLQHNFESRIDDFVGLMNDRAQSLGLDQTMYANPHGKSH
jgi:D-alanyl-D-alanine carboxypeptidase